MEEQRAHIEDCERRIMELVEENSQLSKAAFEANRLVEQLSEKIKVFEYRMEDLSHNNQSLRDKWEAEREQKYRTEVESNNQQITEKLTRIYEEIEKR